MVLCADEQLSLTGKTLIIPIVSTANIAQLAVDLIISSLSLRPQAVLNPEYFIPALGSREDGQPGLVTPLELYSRPDAPVAVLQQRSPVLKSRKEEYIPELIHFIESVKPAQVLILSGVNMSDRTDSQMMTPTYQMIVNPSESSTLIRNLQQLPIPVYSSSSTQYPEGHRDNTNTNTSDRPPRPEIPFIPGGGLTRKIISGIPGPNTWTIPTAALLHFVLEGDNRGDAHLFASVISKVLNLPIQNWVVPESWKQGLFGQPHDQSLYG